MLINQLQPAGAKNRELWQRAGQLVTKDCPDFSTACYRAYDELWRPPLIAPREAAAATSAGTAPVISVPLKVIEFAPVLAELETAPTPPSLNSLADVLAADELNYNALAACLSAKAELAYHVDTVKSNSNFHAFEGGPTFAFGYRSAGHAFLAFRGSRVPFRKNMAWSRSMEILWADWIRTDFNCVPWHWPLRHLGFARAWGRIRQQVIDWLSSLPNDSRSLVLTGHSLGGALALVAAFDLAKDFPIRAVITFGAPRVGLFWFRHRYHTQLTNGKPLHSMTRRYTHCTDRVSRVPPPLLYCHVGDEYVVEDWGGIQEGRPSDLLTRFEEWLDGWKLKIMLWQDKFLADKKRTWFVKEPQTLESGPPPGDATVPYNQSRFKRWEGAWGSFSSRTPSMIGMLAHAPVLVIRLIGVGICLLLSVTVARDVFVEHPCATYLEAFKKAYPNLRKEIT